MEPHIELSDDLFEEQFKTCTIDPAIFSHEAHLRLAWIHCTKYGIDTAIDQFSDQLAAFVDSVGASDKYNKTLTVAAIKAVYHFINKSDTGNFYDFIHQFPRLKYNFRELMAAHYGIDIYNSELAKREYLEPDLLPFS